MYSGLPPAHRRAVKTSLTATWLFSGASGLSAIYWAAVAPVRELGEVGSIITGVCLATATIIAAGGVSFGRYRWEWVSAWFAAASLVPYLVILWSRILIGASDNSTQAFLATSLMGYYITRALLCAAHAAKLREAHVSAVAALQSVTDAEGGGGGARNGD